ncbi:MAG: hypothetical protein ACRBBR_13730 [Cellvibrionaceae bacterium]
MITQLSDTFDTHWAYIDRYMHSSVNIIAKVHLKSYISNQEIDKAVASLSEEHPYITSKLCSKKEKGCEKFYLKRTEEKKIKTSLKTCSNEEIRKKMDLISEYRYKRLNLEQGELLYIDISRSDDETLLEIVFAHLLTDATGAITLTSEILSKLKTKKTDKIKKIKTRKPYDEIRYGWKDRKDETKPIPLPEKLCEKSDPWPQPAFTYKRKEFEKSIFDNIKRWLKKEKIEASVSDFFYYTLKKIYTKKYNQELSTNVVMSYRNKIDDLDDRKGINTLAVFECINIEKNIETPKLWLEEFSSKRKRTINIENIIEFNNKLRMLNKTMPEHDVEKGRKILNTLLPVNSNESIFAFNNYGVIDPLFEKNSDLDIIDIDIQGSVLAQEIRFFSYKEKIHFNMMFSKDNVPFSTESFWNDFLTEIEKTIN